MQGISGLGSGLDVPSLIDKLMEVEKIPIHSLKVKEQKFQAQLSSYGILKNSVDNFKTAMEQLSDFDKFHVNKGISSNEENFTVAVNENASLGHYQINVNKLAQAEKTSSDPFADADTPVGAIGTMQITVGEDSFSIVVDDESNNLTAIKNAINSSEDNTGVKATVINVDDGAGGAESRLVLTADSPGISNTISLVGTSEKLADVLNISTVIDAAQDSEITIDGYTITRSSNVISNAVEGLTITLESTTQSAESLSILRDFDTAEQSVKQFVNSYNSLMVEVNKQSKEALSGDSGIHLLKHEALQILSVPANGTEKFKLLSDVGITSKIADGNLLLDEEQLDLSFQENFFSVLDLFTDKTSGMATKFKEFADNLEEDGGIIKTRTDGINKRIDSVGKRLEKEDRHLESVQHRYEKQFASLDAMMSKMNSTSDYLTQQLSNLQVMGKKGR